MVVMIAVLREDEIAKVNGWSDASHTTEPSESPGIPEMTASGNAAVQVKTTENKELHHIVMPKRDRSMYGACVGDVVTMTSCAGT